MTSLNAVPGLAVPGLFEPGLDAIGGPSLVAAPASATAYDATVAIGVNAEAPNATASANLPSTPTYLTPAYFGSGTGAQTGGGTTMTVSTPASIPAGALMVLFAGGFCSSATPTVSGGGWTVRESIVDVPGTAAFWTWTKTAVGGEGTITITSDGAGMFTTGGVGVYTGVNTTSVVAHSAQEWSATDHPTVTSPTVNNTGIGAELAVFSGAFYNGDTTHGQTTPSNMSVAIDYGDGVEGSAFQFYRLVSPTGSQSYSTTVTGTQTDWYGGDGLLFMSPGIVVRVNAECPNATATANDATAALAGNAEAPTSAAQAYDATVTTSVSVNAECPNATAAAYDATVTVSVSVAAECPNATATAYDAAPVYSGNPTAEVATATAAAYDATVTSAVSVAAECPNATAAAYDAVAALGAMPDAPDAPATAYDPNAGGSTNGLAESPTAAATAYDATTVAAYSASADVATSTGQGYDASVAVSANAECATATAHANDVGGAHSVSVNADVALAYCTAYGALGINGNIPVKIELTWLVPAESRTTPIDHESRTYTPDGDWTGIASLVV